MEVAKISAKTVQNHISFCANPQKQEEKAATKDVTNLSKMPSAQIGITTPISYTKTGKIDILDSIKAETYKLTNGQKVVILPKKGPTIVKTYVNVGSMNEPDNLRGISHYIEHNLFNGTQELKAGEFFNRVNKLGASTNASTSFATTDYYISSQLLKEGDLEEKIKLHADMLQNPTFTPDMLEKERGPVISEISMIMDDPQNIAINRAIKNLYQIQTKSPDLIAGTIENIQNVSRDDVVNYFNTHYTPNNFITVITGEVNPDETIKLVSKYFTKQNPQNQLPKKFEIFTPIEKSIRVEETMDKTKAGHIVMAFAGPQNNNTRDTLTLSLLNSILSSSKNSKLKKALEPLHYNIGLEIEKTGNQQHDNQTLLLLATGSPDKIDNTLQTVYDVIFNAQNGSITQEELDNVKKRTAQTISEVLESSNALNNFIGSSLLNNNYEILTNYKNILDTITLEDIQKVAKKYLDLNKVSISVVKPPKSTQSQNVSFGNKYIEKEVYERGKIKEYRLPNNIDLTTHTSETEKSIISLSLKTPLPANIKPGIDELLHGMLRRGSALKTKEQFYNEAEKNSIDIDISASPNSINICTDSSTQDSKKALSLVKEMLNNPNFSKENFEFVKNQLIDTLKNKNESALENATAELFKYLPYTAKKSELIASLEKATIEDVMGLYKYIMQNSSCVCTTSAPFEKNKNLLTELATDLTLGMPVFKPFEATVFNSFVPLEGNKTITSANNQNQADIVKSYKFKTNLNLSDTAKFAILNIILGGNPNSRLFNDLREKQKLAYRVKSNINYIGNTGVLSLSIKTTTDNPQEGNNKLDNLKKSLNGFDKNTTLLQSKLVSDDELESAKLYLKTTILNLAETSSGKVLMLDDDKNTPYGLKNTELFLKEIDKVTKEGIRMAANYIFQNPSLTSIVASQKTLDYYHTNKGKTA